MWINHAKHGLAHFVVAPILRVMDISEAGRMGAKITNAMMTPEKRSKAAKLGWRRRHAKLRAERRAEKE